MAFGIKLVHTPKPRRYNHVNIYYDPEKEEREERENRVNKQLNVENGIKSDPGEFKTSIKRGTFRRMRQRGEYGAEDENMQALAKKANRRFAIIAVVLLVIALILWMSLDYCLTLLPIK